jgi:hypothetical protein
MKHVQRDAQCGQTLRGGQPPSGFKDDASTGELAISGTAPVPGATTPTAARAERNENPTTSPPSHRPHRRSCRRWLRPARRHAKPRPTRPQDGATGSHPAVASRRTGSGARGVGRVGVPSELAPRGPDSTRLSSPLSNRGGAPSLGTATVSVSGGSVRAAGAVLLGDLSAALFDGQSRSGRSGATASGFESRVCWLVLASASRGWAREA